MFQLTKNQNEIINYRGDRLLVSASAGTGKTTVMVDRIATLIAEKADVSSLVVVTFTNMAAAEMKKRLYDKLAERRGDSRIMAQLEKLDNAAICTLHSFCGDLLRNYFYVADIDPSFAILDDATVATLRNEAMEELCKEYFKTNDAEFKRVYKILSANDRQDETFKKAFLDLYNFSRCLEDFPAWYRQTRENMLDFGEDSLITKAIVSDVRQHVENIAEELTKLAAVCAGMKLDSMQSVCNECATAIENLDYGNVGRLVLQLVQMPVMHINRNRLPKSDVATAAEVKTVATEINNVVDPFIEWLSKYKKLVASGPKTVEQIFDETRATVCYTDKLAEMIEKFDALYFDIKKQRGGVDFNDLEHLTLKVLNDADAAAAIHEKYKWIFVDEYQDTNPVQEAIVAKLGDSSQSNVFVVGDVKQSIYGFRGCEPDIFSQKYEDAEVGKNWHAVNLNENFRSNKHILNYVNDVFNVIMTKPFGSVDYKNKAQLVGSKEVQFAPSVQLDFVVASQIKATVDPDGLYDLTLPNSQTDSVNQAEVIADNVLKFVNSQYLDADGNAHTIGYGDIVILVRNMTAKAENIYDALVERNIPVVANFKLQGYKNKEVRTLITLMRAIANPYNDVYTVGTCLSPIGGFTEDDLAQIKIATRSQRIPFYNRMQQYLASAKNDEISAKIDTLIAFFNKLRFYSHSATVNEVVLKVLELTKFHLYVQGLPNGSLRLRKLYSFVDGLKGASYAQSIDKFLAYLDETESSRAEEGIGATNAVRIMSMHASKGLEFPIVILAATETRFHPDYPSVDRNNKLGLVTKFYKFDTMRKTETLSTLVCRQMNELRQREEEMRLLYVAATRPKIMLNIVGEVSENQLADEPKLPQDAICHLDWILASRKIKYGSVAGTDTPTEKVNVLRELSQGELAQNGAMICPQYTDRDSILKQINATYHQAKQLGLPSKIVSSALDKEFVELDETREDFVLVDNSDRNFVGTAYHKVYQYVSPNASPDEISQTIEGLVHEGQIEPQYANHLDVDLIFNTLNNPDLKKLLQGHVYHELPFMLYVPYNQVVAGDDSLTDEVILQGVIDLLVLNGNKATVIDFKYSTRSEAALKVRYAAQLKSYRLAVEQICGITDVDSYILSVANNKLIKM